MEKRSFAVRCKYLTHLIIVDFYTLFKTIEISTGRQPVFVRDGQMPTPTIGHVTEILVASDFAAF